MKLKDLLLVLTREHLAKGPASTIDPHLEVSDLTADARQVKKDSVFVAIRGTKFDGHSVLADVILQQPVGLIVEDGTRVPADFKGPVVIVTNTRQALAILAARFFGDPSLHFFCFGVTGTNGKTSCTYLMEHLLTRLHLPTGVIGTIEHRLGEQVWSTQNTTPGPLELQSRLSQMRSAGARALAMEVSSHALDQHRADAIHFNAVLFTNLTRDHLDYHPTMEAYFASKQRLFTDLLWESKKAPLVAAINGDDEFGRRLRIAATAEIFTFGQGEENDFQFTPLQMGFDESKFRLRSPFGEITATVPVCGLHSLYNVVGVIAAATALGVAPAIALRAFQDFAGVPGRLQPVANNRGVSIFIDYAHTPDALENVLRSLHAIRADAKLNGRITVVFGCGGDRDPGKRPLMGAIAEKYADQVIVTSDNPRSEDPVKILQQIAEGFTRHHPQVTDRRAAIGQAIREAQAGDVVLIAGKGHEDYQILGTEKIHFSDYEVAREFLV